MSPSYLKTQALTRSAMLFSLCLVLSLLERLLPPPPLPLPVHYGLANIVIMAAVLLLKPRDAISLALLKAGAQVFLASPLAVLLSLAGSLSSVLVMLALARFRPQLSLVLLSISGALVHSLAQIAVLLLFFSRSLTVALPLSLLGLPLLIFSLLSGLLTASLLRLVLPRLQERL